MFQFSDSHQCVDVVKWNEKNEKVLKYSISNGSVLFENLFSQLFETVEYTDCFSAEK